jgi:hypothetical protein
MCILQKTDAHLLPPPLRGKARKSLIIDPEELLSNVTMSESAFVAFLVSSSRISVSAEMFPDTLFILQLMTKCHPKNIQLKIYFLLPSTLRQCCENLQRN